MERDTKEDRDREQRKAGVPPRRINLVWSNITRKWHDHNGYVWECVTQPTTRDRSL